jgi:hypothetical protein
MCVLGGAYLVGTKDGHRITGSPMPAKVPSMERVLD